MLMQGQEAVEASWQAVDECWICVRIVAMWSGCIRDGLCVHVSILGVVCTVTVVATHPPPPPPPPPSKADNGSGVMS